MCAPGTSRVASRTVCAEAAALSSETAAAMANRGMLLHFDHQTVQAAGDVEVREMELVPQHQLHVRFGLFLHHQFMHAVAQRQSAVAEFAQAGLSVTLPCPG